MLDLFFEAGASLRRLFLRSAEPCLKLVKFEPQRIENAFKLLLGLCFKSSPVLAHHVFSQQSKLLFHCFPSTFKFLNLLGLLFGAGICLCFEGFVGSSCVRQLGLLAGNALFLRRNAFVPFGEVSLEPGNRLLEPCYVSLRARVLFG